MSLPGCTRALNMSTFMPRFVHAASKPTCSMTLAGGLEPFLNDLAPGKYHLGENPAAMRASATLSKLAMK